jgi:hypothetical protein
MSIRENRSMTRQRASEDPPPVRHEQRSLSRVRVEAVDSFGLLVEVGLLPARKNDLGSVLGEGLRDRAADAAACPRDERNPARQSNLEVAGTADTIARLNSIQ